MKRFFSCLLTVALLLSLVLPAFAFQTNFSYTVVVGNVVLPLEEYPIGSYCTTTGGACSTAHEHCLRYYTTPDGKVVDMLGWQCMGFARYVFYRCFGIVDFESGGGEGYYAIARNYSISDTTPENMQALFAASVKPGAHIRVGNASNGHSMAYLGSDDTYIYTYEGNYANHCDVTINRRTWGEFCTFAIRKGGISYIHMPNSYPQTMQWNCAQQGHDWTLVKQQASTCTTQGCEKYCCVFCGEERTQMLALAAHQYEKSYSSFVTKDTAGVTVYRCSSCGDTYNETVPALGVCACGVSCPAARMTDIPAASNWAHEGIDFAIANQLFNGTTDTTFSPQSTMTRAMLVTVLFRANEKLPDVDLQTTGQNVAFTDLKQNAYYTAAVAWAASCGIVTGVGDGKFAPNNKVTREQIAVILQRYANYRGVDTTQTTQLSQFADASTVSSFAAAGTSWAVAAGLINGISQGGQTLLAPRSSATRAQVATILMRFVENELMKGYVTTIS